MTPKIFPVLKANAPLASILTQTVNGKAIFKFFLGKAMQQGITPPYATYGVFNGQPENYLDRVPDIDNMSTQIDVWAGTAEQASQVGTMIRDLLEPLGHMTDFDNATQDVETNLWRLRMDFDFFTPRN